MPGFTGGGGWAKTEREDCERVVHLVLHGNLALPEFLLDLDVVNTRVLQPFGERVRAHGSNAHGDEARDCRQKNKRTRTKHCGPQ
ncbi:MAG: hypothetical protein NTY15_10840 [Planctomycetota bacterium]|nr:hypothetical protein [Planctomycetota bacterium]